MMWLLWDQELWEVFSILIKGASFYHLTKLGYRVLGIDQYDTPHNFGSSGGITRSIRLVYYEEEHMAQYLRKSVEMW